jgi:hypothetical protein
MHASEKKIIFLFHSSDISMVEESNAPFVSHPTFDKDLGTSVIDDDFLGYVF